MQTLSRRSFIQWVVAATFTTFFYAISFAAYVPEPLVSVYLTFPEIDTSRAITVHFISKQKLEQPGVEFGDSHTWNLMYVKAGVQKLDGVPRWYYQAQLKGLSPNTVYYFRLTGLPGEYKFRTPPADDSTIRLVQGGDMGYDPSFAEISREAMKREPHAILIGGDLAYANGEKKNYGRWDSWWEGMNEVMTTPEGFLVPLIIAIGNHEVSLKKIGRQGKRAPFYTVQFDQPNGRTYYKKRLGNHTILFVLDSGHIAPHFGGQYFWMRRNFKKEAHMPNKIALYHTPLYPSKRKYNNPVSAALRALWRPLFDKYGLDVAFENHDHALKRTHPLKKNKIVESGGTMYLGDGCWGKSPREVDPDRWYLANAGEAEHVWYAEISPKEMRFEAIGVDGVVFDRATLSK